MSGSRGRRRSGAAALGLAALVFAGCITKPALTERREARRLASELSTALSQMAQATNRAVMATDGATAGAAVNDAKQAGTLVSREIDALRPRLESLGYPDDLEALNDFATRFDEYQRSTSDVWSLIGERTQVGQLSLQNSDARVLALMLGRAHTVQAACEAGLARLEQALAAHELSATR